MGSGMSAGMPGQASQDEIEIGQHIPTFGALNWFKSGAREYLRSGFLRAYSGRYSTFAARVPGGCTNDQAARVAALQNLDGTYPSCAMFFDGTRYVSLAFCPSSTTASAYYSTDLTNWTSMLGTMNNAYSAAQAGPNGTIVVVGNDGTSAAYYKSSGATSFSACSAPSGVLFNSIAFNPAGTLGVMTKANGTQNSAGTHYTTTDAINFTSRTPTGGTNFSVGGVHYSPAAAAFLIVPTAGQSLAVNKTTDGIALSVSLSTDTLVMPGDFANKPHLYMASSPTVTLVSCRGYKLKRTTDGVTWTTVDLMQQNLSFVLAGGTNSAQIYYDSVSAKFYAWVYSLTALQSVVYLTSADGITWTPSFNYRDSNATSTPFVVASANGKSLMAFAYTGSLYDWKDVTTQFQRSTPDWVGTTQVIFGTTAGNSPYSHVRIA